MRITRALEIPEEELEFRFSRSGGPGGQNVNRRATKVELIFDVANSSALTERQRQKLTAALHKRLDSEGRLHLVVQQSRTQAENRARALNRFKELVATAFAPPPPPRRPTKPTRAAKEGRLRAKRVRGARKRERSRPSLED